MFLRRDKDERGVLIIKDTVNNCFYVESIRANVNITDLEKINILKNHLANTKRRVRDEIETTNLLERKNIDIDNIKSVMDLDNPRKNQYFYGTFTINDFLDISKKNLNENFNISFYQIIPSIDKENQTCEVIDLDKEDVNLFSLIEEYKKEKNKNENTFNLNNDEKNFLENERNLPKKIANRIFSVQHTVKICLDSLKNNIERYEMNLKNIENNIVFSETVYNNFNFDFLGNNDLSVEKKIEQMENLTKMLKNGLRDKKDFNIEFETTYGDQDQQEFVASGKIEMSAQKKECFVQDEFGEIEQNKKDILSNLRYIEVYFKISETLGFKKEEWNNRENVEKTLIDNLNKFKELDKKEKKLIESIKKHFKQNAIDTIFVECTSFIPSETLSGSINHFNFGLNQIEKRIDSKMGTVNQPSLKI